VPTHGSLSWRSEIASGKSLTDIGARRRTLAGMTPRGDRLDRAVSRLIVLGVLVVLSLLVWWGSTPH
jgi:hypothetical protein